MYIYIDKIINNLMGENIMKIVIVDGQGGGIGKTIAEKLKLNLIAECDIVAVGTNALATAAMLKAGVANVATGENAVIFNVQDADIIIGSIGIISANSMMGELSPAMANAISSSHAVKVLIPLNRCNLKVMGVDTSSLPAMIDEAVETINQIVKQKNGLY